jgi:hypothetical protein
METAIVIAIFIAVAGLFIGLYLRRRNMVFEGVVTDKDIKEEAIDSPNRPQGSGITFGSSGVRHVYKIKVQTDAGKTLSWQISQGKYEIISIGDKVVKRPGTTDIDIISKPRPATQPPTQLTPPTPPIK